MDAADRMGDRSHERQGFEGQQDPSGGLFYTEKNCRGWPVYADCINKS